MTFGQQIVHHVASLFECQVIFSMVTLSWQSLKRFIISHYQSWKFKACWNIEKIFGFWNYSFFTARDLHDVDNLVIFWFLQILYFYKFWICRRFVKIESNQILNVSSRILYFLTFSKQEACPAFCSHSS